MSLPAPPPSSSTDSTCYRHPDRPAGRRCTRCGRPACAECLTPATVGSHCPECTKAAQPSMGSRMRMASAQQPVLVTLTLIALNVLAFVVTTLLDPDTLTGAIGRVHRDYALAEPFVAHNGEWFRIVTSGFLHFGIIHVGFNMWMLWLLGRMLEPTLGRPQFALLYFASLFGGSLGVIVLTDASTGPIQLSAGASGAVFGLLAAAAVGQIMHGLNPMSTAIGRVLLLNVAFTFIASNISIGGHLGGLVAGAICGAAMLAPAHRGIPRSMAWIAPIVVGATSFGAAIMLASV